MRQIFKNYLATFIKNWLQTIGTVLFILMMFAVVIGFLAAPLQIYAHITSMNRINNHYNQITTDKDFKYNSKFLYDFLISNKTKYTQQGSDGKEHEVLALNGLNDNTQPILSTIYKEALKDIVGTPAGGQHDLEDAYASYLRETISDFTSGALVKTPVYFTLNSTDNAAVTSGPIYDYEQNVQSIINTIDQTEKDAESDNAMKSRGLAVVNAIYQSNGFGVTAVDLQSAVGTNTRIFGQKLVQLMIEDMQKRNVTSQKVYLISSQLFNSNTNVHVGDMPPFTGTSFYALMSRPQYSYDFLNYVNTAAFLDPNNDNAYSNGNQNYDFYTEKTMYYSQTTSSSLFPSLSIELKTINGANEANQIQLKEGRRPTPFTYNYENRQTILEEVMQGEITPEIVINSGYAANNNLHVGDYFTLPDTVEHNTVSGGIIGVNSSDDFLTSGIKYKIVGIGEKFDDTVPGNHYTPFMEDIKTYGNAYVDNGWFDILREARWNNSSTASTNFSSNIRFVNKSWEKSDPVNVINFNTADKNSNEGLYDVSSNPFIDYSNTKTMNSVNNTKIKVIIFIILGVAVLVLAFIFINFIITKELNETRRQIGIFKSFGYKISELSWIFAVKTFLTIFVGAVLGWVVSIAIQTWSAGNYVSSVMFQFDHIYAGAAFMVIIIVVIPAIFLLVSYVMTLFYLREPTLSLLSNGAKVKKNTAKHGPLLKYLARTGKGFGYRLQQGFVKDSMGKFIVVQILFAIASLTFTLMFGAQSLMYSVANQGFSVLSKNADHRYAWQNQDGINISYDADKSNPKYSLNDENTFKERQFKYVSYSGKQKIGDVLNADKSMSDSRYRENFLIQSISNTFDVNKDEAWEMLMPIDYYLVNNGGIKQKDLPTIVTTANGFTEQQVKAAEQDAKIPDAIATQEMAYNDHYLNWILAFRIGIMNEKDADGIKGMETIKNDLINGTGTFNLDALAKYADDWENKYGDSNPIKINMNNIADASKAAELKKEFADTLFGLSDTTPNPDPNATIKKQKNNLFLSDITKIITLELAQSYAEDHYNSFLAKNQAVNKIYTTDAIVSSWKQDKALSIWEDFSPNNTKYWGMQNNPLMASLINGGSSSSGQSSGDDGSSSASGNGGGLSLSKMNAQTISLIMAASMLGYNSKDLQQMPTITLNQAFFNKDTESLFENISVTGVDDSQNGRNSITLFDYRDNKYGTYNNSLRHEGVSDDTYKKLATDTGEPDLIYAVVPYGLARYRNIHVGDTFVVNTDTKQKRSIKLKVIGINKSVAFSLGGGWSIDADYNQFANKFFDDTLRNYVDDQKGDLPLFNSWASNEPMLTGDIDLKNIPESVNKMKYVGKNLAMSIAPGSSVFGSIFNGMVNFSTLLGSNIDPEYRLITNPNIASTSKYSSVLPFNILKAGVNQGISDINNILIVFMVLVAVMLLIILVVVMNIIVEQATPIILTLKSLGYSQREINWITMGSYITGAVISFIVAYCVSLAIWNIFLAVAGSLWHIYVFMSYSWEAPVVTFLVIGAILFIGWFVSDRKVQKIPLTLVTGFN